MKNLKKKHLVLIAVSSLILFVCIGITAYFLFSNYQNVRLFKQAQSNFQRDDADSLQLAKKQLIQLIASDDDNEAAYIMLGEIAGKQKIYSEQLYYCYMAYRLNPLSTENKIRYAKSLFLARYFDRLENFLSQQEELWEQFDGIRLYAAGRNGNINKYKARFQQDNSFRELAFLLFKNDKLSAKEKLEKLKTFPLDDPFLKQEILAAKVEFYVSIQDYENTRKALEEACELNFFAFAPVLGRFYANYQSFGKALVIFEKYLSSCHDHEAAMHVAEIYAILKQTDKISQLREKFQSDSGSIALMCCYYLDALAAYAKNDMVALKELTVPLRKNINTALADFIFFLADIQDNDPAAIRESYIALTARQNYLGLQSRADNMLSDWLKKNAAANGTLNEDLLPLANALYKRKPELFTAKFILLVQKKRNTVNAVLLKDALTRFSKDQGISKIAIEYYLNRDLPESERLISYFRNTFPDRKRDMLRYEMILAMRKKDFDRVSELFKSNFSVGLLPEYWNFASSSGRKDDLLFLSKDKVYEPFCTALLLLKDGKKSSACDLLEKADAAGNASLLFFAAKTLAENGRNQAALDKYARFPENTPFRQAVLLNMAELYAENGDAVKAVELSGKAYALNPESPETQFCYADKLFKSGNLLLIPDVLKLTLVTPNRRETEKLWIAGMEARLRACDFKNQQEKIRELCRQVLVIDPDNDIAARLLKQLKKMPQ